MNIRKNKTDVLSFGEVIVYVYLLILLVMSKNEASTTYGVVIPYLHFTQAYIFLGLGIAGLVRVLFNRILRLDLITMLLLGRIFLSLFPALRGNLHSSYFGNFVMACVPFLIYLLFRNTKVDIRKITNAFIIFGLFVALQCILAYFTILYKGLATYDAPYYKNYFVIPVGATNNISAVLLPLLILGDQIIEKTTRRTCYTILLLIGIFLCKSRTGMILSVCYLLFKLFIKERGKYKTWKKMAIIALPIMGVIAIVLLFNSNIGKYIRSLMLGYSSSGEGINALFSGRFSLFGKTFDLILDHPFIGNGLTYEKLDFWRPHNVLLQIMFENGIIGLCGILIFLIYSVQRIIAFKDRDRYIYAFSVAIPFILVNAMVEDSMMTNFMILFGLVYLAHIGKLDDGRTKNV